VLGTAGREGHVVPTNQQKHDAGRHLAVAEALLCGYKATIVGRQSRIEVNGHEAQVQVATMGAWVIANVDDYTSGTIDHVVLVGITGGLREFFICPGDALRSELRQRYDEVHQGARPRNPGSKQATIYPEHVLNWRDGWNRFD
jgi:hypothetical protein